MTPREYLTQLQAEADRSKFNHKLKMWVSDDSSVARFVAEYEKLSQEHK